MRAGNQFVLPINMNIMIPEDDPVRKLDEILEELNYSKLLCQYERLGRKDIVHPITMFKIIVYGYMNRIYSSRDLEKACKRDISFMWLLDNEVVPDNNAIARFRSERVPDVTDELFEQFIKELHSRGEVSLENVFIDGTKIEANANRYSFVWKGSVDKSSTRMQDKLRIKLPEITKEFGLRIYVDKLIKAKDIKKIWKS